VNDRFVEFINNNGLTTPAGIKNGSSSAVDTGSTKTRDWLQGRGRGRKEWFSYEPMREA
jgi:hypothetical protein